MSESSFQKQSKQKTQTTLSAQVATSIEQARFVATAQQSRTQEGQRDIFDSTYAANRQLYSDMCSTYSTDAYKSEITPCVVEALPAQPVQAPKESNKEKRKKNSRLKEYQKTNPNMTMDQMLGMEQAKDVYMEKRHSVDPKVDELNAAGVDLRVANILAKGYKVDKKGNPLNEEEAQKKADDQAMLDAFISKDLTRKKPYLDKITKRVLSFRITDAMMNPEYIREHSVEMSQYAQELGYIENLMKSEKAYFEALPKIVQDRLQRMSGLQGLYSSFVDHTLMSFGIKSTGAVLSDQEKGAYVTVSAAERMAVEAAQADYQEKEREYKDTYTAALADGIKEVVTAVHPSTAVGELGTMVKYRKTPTGPEIEEPIAEVLHRELKANIEKSNEGKDRGGKLTNLGLRGNDVSAIAIKALKASVYDAAPENKLELYRALYRSGFPLELIDKDAQKYNVGAGQYFDNEPLHVLAKKEFENFNGILMSDKSVEYISIIYNEVKDAKVFSDPTDAVGYIVQDLYNRVGCYYQNVSLDAQLGEDRGPIGEIAKRVSANLMRSVSFYVDKKDTKGMPDSLVELASMVASSVEELTRRVLEKVGSGSGAGAAGDAGAGGGAAPDSTGADA